MTLTDALTAIGITYTLLGASVLLVVGTRFGSPLLLFLAGVLFICAAQALLHDVGGEDE